MVAPSPQTILLVDGYNVIGAWPKLQKVKEREGLEEARQGLIERLTNYSAFHGCPTKIVFYHDAVRILRLYLSTLPVKQVGSVKRKPPSVFRVLMIIFVLNAHQFGPEKIQCKEMSVAFFSLKLLS